MLQRDNPLVPISAPGLYVALEREMHVGALRHFELTCELQSVVQSAFGVSLPRVRQATMVPVQERRVGPILAWRSPTEVLLLSAEAALFDTLATKYASRTRGCFVDQTGGLCVLRAKGARVADILVRLGGDNAIPGLGEAKRGRMAEVPVLALRANGEDLLLVVDRMHTEHLMNWIRVSAQDLDLVTGISR